MRGFTLDNRFNYRRDGLPINAETAIAAGQQGAHRGAQGHQRHPGRHQLAGRPGQPGRQAARRAPCAGSLGWRAERQSCWPRSTWASASATTSAFGLRLNAAYEHLDPQTHDADGQPLACWRWPPTGGCAPTRCSKPSSRSQPPAAAQRAGLQPARRPRARRRAIDPRINLNNQPWSQPVGVRRQHRVAALTQTLDADWRCPAHALTQQLTSDDRIAFPYGCSAEGRYDRYCSDGSFDLYDFRSDERTPPQRRARPGVERHAAPPAGVMHHVGAGVLAHALRGAASSARPSTTPAPATSTAASSCPPHPLPLTDEHQPRRTQHRAVPARRHRTAPRWNAVGRPAPHAAERAPTARGTSYSSFTDTLAGR